MLENFIRFIVIFYIIYGIFLSSLSFEITTKKYIRKFEYNGLVWISLDLYSIKKYKSRDIPMRLFKYEKIIIDENTTGN